MNDLSMPKSGYRKIQAFANSKLANILFTNELHRRFHKSDGVSSYTIYPGANTTELSNFMNQEFPTLWNYTFGMIFKAFFNNLSINGAQTVMHCAISEDLEKSSGCCFK